ncbi:BTAD domain-containing putative transcriptional regulator [Pseudarthrobacter siccitolerans]
MGALRIRALGPLEVVADGRTVLLGSEKLRIVLECLVLMPNTVVTADFLAAAVWDGSLPAHPGAQLQVYIANLRRLLQPGRPKGVPSQRLASRPGGYLLSVADDEVDLLQFRAYIAAGEQAVQAGDLVAGARQLRQGVGLFRGRIFPELADLELLAPDLEMLEEAWLDAYQDLAEVELALGRHNTLAGELQRLVSKHPFHERLWASLVVALYRSGRQADALAAARHARKVFMTELGIDPGMRLRELEALVLRQDTSLDVPAVNADRPSQRLENLPAPVTPLVGREAELKEVCSLYRSKECRLVTVTGPGGAGKTRLVLAAAARLGQQMNDGVGWVNLAPLSDVHQVPGAIATTLGLDDWSGEDPLKAASRFLRTRRLLLVLDNFEHLEDAWPMVVDLLTAAPDLRILTTSRRRLGLRAEYEYELGPLALPPLEPALPPSRLREVPAMKLLLNRGRAVRPHFDVDPGNAAVLTRLCHRLDGLPLAIELAAAQLRYRTEQALLADLERSLNDLPAAFRDLPERQRTLTAAITWSYQLLGRNEQQLLVHLGVFAGDPTVEAIAAICNGATEVQPRIGELLASLADQSLLRPHTDATGHQRVSMLQSIREFARDRLALLSGATTIRLQHARYYLSLAEAVGPRLWGPGQIEAFRTLQSDALDLRAALLWAAGPDAAPEIGLRMVGQLWHYWELTGDVAEEQHLAVGIVEKATDAAPEVLAPALSGAATLCWTAGRFSDAARFHQAALAAFDCARNAAGAAWTTMCLAVQAAQTDDLATAERLAAEAVRSPAASPRTRVASLVVLSRLAFYAGDVAVTLELSRRCAEMARSIGDRWLVGIGLVNLAEALEQAGDYDGAESLMCEAITTALELRAQGHLTGFLDSLAGVYLARHRTELAIRLLASADSYRADRGQLLDGAERRRVDEIVAKARAEAGSVRFALAWSAGKALSPTQAADEVLRRSARHPGADVKHADSSWPETDEAVNPAPW